MLGCFVLLCKGKHNICNYQNFNIILTYKNNCYFICIYQNIVLSLYCNQITIIMSRRVKVEWKVEWTIQNCIDNLNNGLMGIVEYHLHKDNSWIGYPFVTMEDKNKAIAELKNDGYDYDTITYFEPTLQKLQNPTRTAEQHLNNLLSFYEKNKIIN